MLLLLSTDAFSASQLQRDDYLQAGMYAGNRA